MNFNDALYQNNIDKNPGFTVAKATGYELSSDSYCVNAGDPASNTYGIPSTDLKDSARIYDGTIDIIDIGAYELDSDPSNRLPILTAVGNQISETNVTLNLTVEFEDVDAADTHTITVTSDEANITVQNLSGDVTGSTYDLVPAASWKGTANITVTIDDGSGETSEYNTETYQLLVGDVYDLCGIVSTNLTIVDDIVRISCPVTVNDGITMTIPSGTYIEFQDNYAFNINGRLLAEGTSTDNIYFMIPSGNEAIGWGGIHFIVDSATNNPSIIDYCQFEYGINAGNGGVISATNSQDISVTNSYFANNEAISGGVIYISNSDIVITDNIFENNTANNGAVFYSTDSTKFVFEDNTLNNNTANNDGGAVYISSTSFQTPSIQGNTFSENIATVNGGAISIVKGDPIIQSNTFSNNTSYNLGGAIFGSDTCYVDISNNSFAANSATNGGAIYFTSADSVDISHNILRNNYASGSGGALYSAETDIYLDNNLLYENKAYDGGAIYINDSLPVLTSNTIINNEADQYGGMIYILNANPKIINTISWDNTASGGNQIYIDGILIPV